MSNGFLDRLLVGLQNNPSAATGSLTFAIAFALVVGNAFYAQSGSHPDPIWATRDLTTTQSVEPRIRSVQTKRILPKVETDITEINSKPLRSKLVEDIQAALKKTGDYKGAIDGLIGPVTRSAITSFQKRQEIAQTGQPSPDLLDDINRQLPALVSARANPQDKLSQTIRSAKPVISPKRRPIDEQFIQTLQTVLGKENGEAIDVDGIMGSQTRNALKEFQRKNGLEVTGKPDHETILFMERRGILVFS